MLEFYPNPMIAHQGLLQGHHHDSITTSMSCNGHGRTGMLSVIRISRKIMMIVSVRVVRSLRFLKIKF